jgi:general secretion pathway protein A
VYEEFFGFREKPFNITPNPRYLYLSPQHQEALAHLQYAHQERGGFVLISGEVGTGKTTVARHFLAGLGPNTSAAVVLFPVLSSVELLQTILADLRVPIPEEASLKTLVDRLHAFLLDARAENRNVVVLIDEAQDLSEEVLEQVRLISNLETDTEKLLQIVLVGQSEIEELLARPKLRQINQRVTTRFHLTALDERACGAYVYHRLKVAGGEGRVVFTPKALRAIFRRSHGIPRLVNLLCDRALLGGFASGTRWVDGPLVERAAREVLPRRRPRRLWLVGASVAVVLMAAIAGAALWRPIRHSWSPLAIAPSPTPRPLATPTPQAPRSATLANAIVGLDRDGSYAEALAAARGLWATPPPDVTALRTTMAQVRRFDLPVILEVVHTSAPAPVFVALLGLNGDQAVVGIGRARIAATVSEIDALWTKQAYFPWPGPGPREARAEWAARALQAAGVTVTVTDPIRATAVFQRQVALVPDGALGPRTLLGLYCVTVPDRPHLLPEPVS